MNTTLSAKEMQALQDIIVEQLDIKPEQLTPEATLSDLGADSLDIVEITMRVEEAFGVSVPDDVVVKTAGDVFEVAANLLEKR